MSRYGDCGSRYAVGVHQNLRDVRQNGSHDGNNVIRVGDVLQVGLFRGLPKI